MSFIVYSKRVPRGRARGVRGDGGEGSNRDKERAEHRRRSRSSPTYRRSAAGHKKAFADSAGGTGGLGFTTSCRSRACNGTRLRGSRLAYRRYDLTALRGDPRHSRRLSRARRGLAANTATGKAPMKTGTRRSLRRVWRVMTWPLSGHAAWRSRPVLPVGSQPRAIPT
jgi:hypothetical protein